jgi:hypothetical protein
MDSDPTGERGAAPPRSAFASRSIPILGTLEKHAFDEAEPADVIAGLEIPAAIIAEAGAPPSSPQAPPRPVGPPESRRSWEAPPRPPTAVAPPIIPAQPPAGIGPLTDEERTVLHVFRLLGKVLARGTLSPLERCILAGGLGIFEQLATAGAEVIQRTDHARPGRPSTGGDPPTTRGGSSGRKKKSGPPPGQKPSDSSGSRSS